MLITHSFTMITILLALLFSPFLPSFWYLVSLFFYLCSTIDLLLQLLLLLFPFIKNIYSAEEKVCNHRYKTFIILAQLLLFDLTVRLLLLAFLFSKLHIKEKPRRKKQSNIWQQQIAVKSRNTIFFWWTSWLMISVLRL